MSRENDLYDSDLRVISQIIKDKIFVPTNKRKTTIFLCGADIKNKKTYRYKMAALFGKSRKFELLYLRICLKICWLDKGLTACWSWRIYWLEV